MSKVEIFEVGFEQLGELVGYSHRDDSGCEIGDYVMISTWICFGGGGHLVYTIFDSFKSLDKAADKQRYMFASDLYHMQYVAEMHAHDYEIWHVVDDIDLWGKWDFRVREAKLEAQRKASACRISLDNGQTFLDPVRDDVDLQELIEHLDENPYDWDGIVVSAMDDETREFTHLTSSYTGMMPDKCMSTAKINAMWLCDYLANAEQDLIW